MERSEKTVIVYSMEQDFFVEVEKNKNVFEFWIYHKNVGIKDFMFGIPVKMLTGKEDIEKMIENNFESYKTLYKRDYM